MILVIDKNRKNALCVADMFFYMGVLSRAATLSEAFSEISNTYRAILLLSPESYPDAEDFIKRLHSYNATMPIFLISETEEYHSQYVAKVFPSSLYAAEVLVNILNYTISNNLPQPGNYTLAGLNLSCNERSPSYFSKLLPLTKTEAMIVKYLIRTHPRPITSEEILKYAYRESKVPEVSNIRTHISIINKKFRDIAGRNLIEMSLTTGYTLITTKTEPATI